MSANVELWGCPETGNELLAANCGRKVAEEAEARAAGAVVSERLGTLTMRAEAETEAVVMPWMPGDVWRGLDFARSMLADVGGGGGDDGTIEGLIEIVEVSLRVSGRDEAAAESMSGERATKSRKGVSIASDISGTNQP